MGLDPKCRARGPDFKSKVKSMLHQQIRLCYTIAYCDTIPMRNCHIYIHHMYYWPIMYAPILSLQATSPQAMNRLLCTYVPSTCGVLNIRFQSEECSRTSSGNVKASSSSKRCYRSILRDYITESFI